MFEFSNCTLSKTKSCSNLLRNTANVNSIKLCNKTKKVLEIVSAICINFSTILELSYKFKLNTGNKGKKSVVLWISVEIKQQIPLFPWSS